MGGLFLWSAAHALHWAVLYAAFIAGMDGALSVVAFWAWVMAPLSLLLLSRRAIIDGAKRPARRFRVALSMAQAWVTLGALVWFGHPFTAAAWGVMMVVLSLYRRACASERSGAAVA